jgi:hypothetical protein
MNRLCDPPPMPAGKIRARVTAGVAVSQWLESVPAFLAILRRRLVAAYGSEAIASPL